MSESESESNLFEEYQQRLAKEHEQACEALKTHFDLLQSLNIDTLIISYDGCNDSGAVESVTAFDANNQEVQLPQDLDEELTELAETLLPFGWEINEGAYGQYTLDVPERELVREHNWRVEATELETETWQL